MCVDEADRSLSSSTLVLARRPSMPGWPTGSTWPRSARGQGIGQGGCIDQSSVVTVNLWSLDGLLLAPQAFSADTEPGQGGKGQTDGLLGNDVLSRFGAVRIDYDAGALVLPGPEGAPLSTSTFTGPKGPVPTELTKGQGVVVPAEAMTGPNNDYLSVPVRFGDEPPTGSSWTQGRRHDAGPVGPQRGIPQSHGPGGPL